VHIGCLYETLTYLFVTIVILIGDMNISDGVWT